MKITFITFALVIAVANLFGDQGSLGNPHQQHLQFYMEKLILTPQFFCLGSILYFYMDLERGSFG